MRFWLTSMMSFIFLAGCGREDPGLIEAIPPLAEAAYRLELHTYHNGDFADQPFMLTSQPKLAGRPGDDISMQLLKSGDSCRNVDVVQQPGQIYIFYDTLTVRWFSSIHYEPNPQTLLCDLQFPECKAIRARLIEVGGKPYNICANRNPADPQVLQP